MQLILPLVTLVTVALSAPAPAPYPIVERQELTGHNASLPNITIFATGGTIAGSAGSSTQTIGYQAGALGVQTLIDAVPSILNISNVFGVQVSNVDSGSITPAILLNLTRQITAAVRDPYVQGVVITHGTDTLEETAFFTALTVSTDKPIVIVGSMRPATAISADGPENLLAAVTLAADPAARGRGPMVVLNDRIGSAYYTTKTNANQLDTFKAVEGGYLGYFINIKPKFYYPPSLPNGAQYFDLSNTSSLPQVDILFGHQALNPALVTASRQSGAKGIVLAGMGAGGWTTPGKVAVQEAVGNGTICVYSHRSQDGMVPGEGAQDGIASGLLNPQKSRILLQLAINAGYSYNATQAIFEI